MNRKKSGNQEIKNQEIFPVWVLFCYFLMLTLLPIQTPISVVITSLGLPSFLALWKEFLAILIMIFLSIKIFKIAQEDIKKH
jgi:hypothetical protein